MLVLDMNNIKDAKITLSLIFINILCYFIFNLVLNESIILGLVQINRFIIENLEVWRLFTSMFLHADIFHLFFNMIALLLFGVTIENSRRYTKIQYLIIYILSGLIGNLFSLFLLPPEVISLGASGAIFGLIGATFIMIYTEDKSLLFLGFIYICYFIITSLAPGINLWAHLFGLLGGISFGYIFKKKKVRDPYY